MTKDNEITTLGRGGSDLTAVALAIALKARVCEIFTDVEGIYTTDPRIVKEARKIREITFDEMLEMASLGARSCKPDPSRSPAGSICRCMSVQVFQGGRYDDCEEYQKVEDISVSDHLQQIRGQDHDLRRAGQARCRGPDFYGDLKVGVSVDTIVQNVSHTRQTDIRLRSPRVICPRR